MSYWTISQMAYDGDLTARVRACAAQEVPEDPGWAGNHMLLVCAQPGWSEAWESAQASGNPTPGRDPAVITDGQILSAVQYVAGIGG